jgi:diaminopropionate ammonia-lyase
VLVAVEPEDAACVGASLRAGHLVSTPGPHGTSIVGLNCGTPSKVAWPILAAGLDAAVAISGADAEDAMRLLATAGVVAGATGAASAAGAQAVLSDPTMRRDLGISADPTVVVLVTEGATDPDHYAAAVRSPSRTDERG